MTDDIATYRARFEAHLPLIARNLESLTREYLVTLPHIDRVSARAKDPDRFAAKANNRHDDGTRKYGHPLTEIQDQLGLRVLVFYLTTVEDVANALSRYFRPIEERELVPESHWTFGYFGHHAVMALPADVIPAEVHVEEAPRFFELQIKTLFQHAWSEANHDLAYKAQRALTGDEQRRFAFAAAQAWGADRAFEELQAQLMHDSHST